RGVGVPSRIRTRNREHLFRAEGAGGGVAVERLELTLFVSGASPASARALRRLREICERHFASRYELKVVDIYQQPAEVVARGVLAVPTLIKELPLPQRVLIGDFTDEARVLAGLG